MVSLKWLKSTPEVQKLAPDEPVEDLESPFDLKMRYGM